MDMLTIAGLVVGLALLVGVVVAVRSRRTAGHPDGGPASSPSAICLFCQRPISETEQVAGLNERAVHN